MIFDYNYFQAIQTAFFYKKNAPKKSDLFMFLDLQWKRGNRKGKVRKIQKVQKVQKVQKEQKVPQSTESTKRTKSTEST